MEKHLSLVRMSYVLMFTPHLSIRPSLGKRWNRSLEEETSQSGKYALCADVYPTFMYLSLSGEEVELIPGGRIISV